MGASPEKGSAAGSLRERHVAKAPSSHINASNSTEQDAQNGSGHVGKAKKTFGRTPDGTGEQHKYPGGVWRPGNGLCML